QIRRLLPRLPSLQIHRPPSTRGPCKSIAHTTRNPPRNFCKSSARVSCNMTAVRFANPPPMQRMVLCAAHVRMEKDFDRWNEIKKATNAADEAARLYFREGEIWWVRLGHNVGYEADGKSREFTRPVVVLHCPIIQRDPRIGLRLGLNRIACCTSDIACS